MYLLYVIVLAIIVALLRGGRIQNIARHSVRGILLPIAAFLLEAAFPLVFTYFPQHIPLFLPAIVIAEYLLLFIFFFINRGMLSMLWLALGSLLNFVVISLNGFKMPVSLDILNYPKFEEFVLRIKSGELFEYALVTGETKLSFLGDVLYTPLVPGLSFASIGDAMLAVGIFLLIQNMMGAGKKKEVSLEEHPTTYFRFK